ncbi:MAG TPA: hypothetical protein VJB99_01330 [Patescibacteria group bacterium]|nr:hypothetical protein [Patescibacteria group bacterium]
MKNRAFSLFFLTNFALAGFLQAFSVQAGTFNPHYLVSDEEFTDAFSLELGEVQAILDRGGLTGLVTEDVDGEKRTAAEIIWRASQRNGVSSKVILTMLQKEQALVTDPSPSQDQLDWATGYGVCDDCSHDDPAIQRFRGFAKQINSATLQFTDGYLADLEKKGETSMGFAPGRRSLIDGTPVIPANKATAALYTYTPHLLGNRNFVAIWQQWFARSYPSGSLLQNTEDGGVWLIQAGKRRPITSRATLLSRFDPSRILPVSRSELEVYPFGTPITLPNYSLLHATNGDIFLLVDDTIRHIVSMEAFRATGFQIEELVEVLETELAGFAVGEPITVQSAYPKGALLQDQKTGGIFFAQDGKKHPIMSPEILKAKFDNQPILKADQQELDLYPTSDSVLFPDGMLIGVQGSPDIFLVSEGRRRPILNASIFLGFGWQWDQIVWTNERSVLLHPLGETLSAVTASETQGDALQMAGNP